MIKIFVIGCGWLGFPLAKKFVEKNFTVYGSTTSENKIQKLEKSGIIPFLFSINDIKNEDKLIFSQADVLILNFPPSNIKIENFQYFINSIPENVKKIIFTSSISVYGEQFGIITEENELKAISENGKKLIQMESILLEKFPEKIVILRLAGLVGIERHPVKYLSGKNNLEDGELNINLVHLEDCINVIYSFAENKLKGIYNVCEDYHPSKKEFYNKAAEKLKLIPPEFNDSKINSISERIIASNKLLNNLNYNFSGNIGKFIL